MNAREGYMISMGLKMKELDITSSTEKSTWIQTTFSRCFLEEAEQACSSTRVVSINTNILKEGGLSSSSTRKMEDPNSQLIQLCSFCNKCFLLF